VQKRHAYFHGELLLVDKFCYLRYLIANQKRENK